MERIRRLSSQIIKTEDSSKSTKNNGEKSNAVLAKTTNINDNSALMLDFKKQMSLIKHSKSMMNVDNANTLKFVETQTVRLSDYAAQNLTTSQIFFYKPELLTEKSLTSPRSPKEGWFYIKMPFSTDESLRFRFQNIDDQTMRTGKILELMDYCAGISSFRHVQKPDGSMPVSIVTGCLDNVLFFQQIPIYQDLYVQGYLTWVGTSSLEVRIDLFGDSQDKKGRKYDLYGCAFFLMVAKSNKTETDYQIPKLEFEQNDDIERCQLRWEMAKNHQRVRFQKKHDNLFKNPPTAEESIELHKLWQQVKSAPQNYARIKDTNAFKQIVMHHQDKNIYSMVFGGVILREAYDSAFSAVYLYSGEEPDLFHIDDVQFWTGVKIGSLVNYHAQIIYVEKHLAHVKVTVTKIEPSEHLRLQKTSEVHLTMFSKKELKQLRPKTYEESVDYLDGKRRVTRISNSF